MRPLTQAEKQARAHKRAQTAENVRKYNTPRADPEYASRAAPNAYNEGFSKVAKAADEAVCRQVRTMVQGGTLDRYGVSHVREILHKNAHVRTLQVKERAGTRVVGPVGVHDAYTRTQNKVSTAIAVSVGKASEREHLRSRLTHAQHMFTCTTGKARSRWAQACRRLTAEMHAR